jgi:hypothetical protein
LGSWGELRTSNTDAINVVGNDALHLHDAVELGSSAMKDNGVETDTVKEAQAKSELLDLVQDGAANFNDSELCRMVGMRRGRENTEIPLDLLFGANGVEQSGDSVLGALKC